MDPVNAVTVRVTGTDIFVEDRRVDVVPAESLRELRLRRIDQLFYAMKGGRTLWKSEHPGEEFPGVVQFLFDQNATLAVVKSVFQTSAFAGYPNASFLVNRIGGSGLGRLNADAIVPGPPSTPESASSPEPRLHIDLISREASQLVWKHGASVTNILDVPTGLVAESGGDSGAPVRFPKLASAVDEEWRRHGLHREASDRRFDQAVVRAPNALEFKYLIAAIDAVFTPKRKFSFGGKTETVPAFNVSFAIR